jgi:hypothetical protein
MYINLEKYVIHWLNFMSNLLFELFGWRGGMKIMKHFGGGGANCKSLGTSDLDLRS